MAHGRFPSLTPPAYQAIPLTRVPGIQIITDPFSMQSGAVNFDLSAQLFGPSAIPAALPSSDLTFTQGVLSFWMRYNSGASASGDSARIFQQQHDTTKNSNTLLNCVVNPIINANNASIQQPFLGCIGMFADPAQINFVLQNPNGVGLVSVAVPYVANDGNSTESWVNLGSFASNWFAPEPSLWNGRTINLPAASALMSPCGGQIAPFTFVTYTAAGDNFQNSYGTEIGGLITPNVISPDEASMRPVNITANFNLVRTGPNPSGTVSLSQVPANIYIPGNSVKGGTPTTGWHHYIFSFDTSQIVTDANGTQTIRVQAAIDGAGGSIVGGPLFDTKTGGGPLTSQAFPSWTPQTSTTGVLKITDNDVWTIEAPSDAPVDFAYCYFGVSAFGEGFYDLTVPANIHRFRTATGAAANFGRAGILIPLDPIFMHTGDMGSGVFGTPLSPITAPRFPINAVQPFVPFSRNPFVPGTTLLPWTKAGRLTSTDGPPIDVAMPF